METRKTVTYVGKDPSAEWLILKRSVSIYLSTYLSESFNVQQNSLKLLLYIVECSAATCWTEERLNIKHTEMTDWLHVCLCDSIEKRTMIGTSPHSDPPGVKQTTN
jgi:hypothetical protein